jgi:hypothetical protein
VREGLKLPEFGPTDSDGFRTVSFYATEGGEALRVSLHIGRLRQQFAGTASNLDHYSADEQEGLRTAAVLAAAREASSLHDPGLVLATMLDLLIPKLVTEQTEKHFPELARIALQAVQDACVKYAVSGVVEMNNAPRIYGEETAEWILRDLTATIKKGFLRIRAGRPAEVGQQLKDTREALNRIKKRKKLSDGTKPTQQQVAEELGIGVRTLRQWPRACKLTWEEWLTASQWESIDKAEIPDEWLTACRQSESAEKGEEN